MVDLAIIATRPDRDAFLTTFQDLLEQVNIGGFAVRIIHDWTEDEDFSGWLQAKFGNAWTVTSSREVRREWETGPSARLVIEAGAQPGKLP